MGANQGIYKFSSGFSRKLTSSELNRGYLFVSLDKNIKNIHELKILVNKTKVLYKNIDNSGRVYVGKKIVDEIGDKNIFLKIKGNVLSISY